MNKYVLKHRFWYDTCSHACRLDLNQSYHEYICMVYGNLELWAFSFIIFMFICKKYFVLCVLKKIEKWQ